MLNQMAIGCFLSLSKTLNFSKTARQLFISQQAVSRYIAKLEEDIGYLLFIRTKHNVKLTQAGHIYAELFAKFRLEYDETYRIVSNIYNDNEVHFHIAYLDWLDISSELNYAVKELRKQFPGLRIFTERQRQKKLNVLIEENIVDCIITYKSFATELETFSARTLFETDYVILAGRDNENTDKTTSYLDFKNSVYLKAQEINENHAETEEKARQDCTKFSLTPQLIRAVPNIETAYTLAEMGEGVLISTAISRMATDGKMLVYSTNQKEKLVCIWNGSKNKHVISQFIACLGDAYNLKYREEDK